MTSVARRYAGENRSANRVHSSAISDDARAPVLLMVSGGADSTALLVLAANSALDVGDGRGVAPIARERLHVLHVNHQLRGMDAEEDQEFVCELASRYGIPCTVRRIDVAALAQQLRMSGGADAANVEAVGRNARYALARALADELSSSFGTSRAAARILTAHTADDRAETFVMNALRGSGPAGLASIARQRGRIVRPLLDQTHDELCELLRMRGIVWREDATNSDTRYLRSYIRHEVMPVLAARNSHVVRNLATSCDILGDEDAYLTGLAAQAYRKLIRRRGDGLVILDAARLGASDVALARRIVRLALAEVCPQARLEARHVAAILTSVAANKGSIMVPIDVSARIEHGVLIIRDMTADIARDETPATWLEVQGMGSNTNPSHGGKGRRRITAYSEKPKSTDDPAQGVRVSGGRTLTARLVAVPNGLSAVDLARVHAQEWEGMSVLLDAKSCGIDITTGGCLWVDTPSPGDVICPLGMHGQSKKLSDLLGEARVPTIDRASVPIVRSSPTGPILWIAGIRPSEDARCHADSHYLLELTLHEANDR